MRGSAWRVPKVKLFVLFVCVCVRVYLRLLNMTSVEGPPCREHARTQSERRAARNSVVFVLSESCLFKGGLVCAAEALNNN